VDPSSIVIGVPNQTLAVTFPVAIGNGARKAAQELGIKVVELDSQNKEDVQANQVQDLIAQGVNGIVLVPLNPGTAKGLVDKASEAGIPIGTAHGYVGDNGPKQPYDKLAFAILEDETATGGKAADIALKAVPNGGKVAIIDGQAGFIENKQRTEQFKAKLKAAGNFDIVAEQPGDWTKEKGQAACQNILAGNPDIALFYALSDDMAVGCAEAVKAAGSKAKIIGVGGSKLGIQAIKDGTITGTVCYKPEDNGYLAVKKMFGIIEGTEQATGTSTFYDTPAITVDNVGDCTPQW
jgi:ribose transport system substrate-binding protein